MVRFIGGVGRIKSSRPESKNWTYAVEMEMGAEPDFGRVGAETTIILYEEDILEVACYDAEFSQITPELYTFRSIILA